MKKLLDDYVYRNLSKYGNAYINESTYKKLGKKAILCDLKNHGFICVVKMYVHKNYDDMDFVPGKFSYKYTNQFERNIVLELK